jgi:hypothetical protein
MSPRAISFFVSTRFVPSHWLGGDLQSPLNTPGAALHSSASRNV